VEQQRGREKSGGGYDKKRMEEAEAIAGGERERESKRVRRVSVGWGEDDGVDGVGGYGR
jgi:hypothetical protein